MSDTLYDWVVIGNGWAALGAVSCAIETGKSVLWVKGSGSRCKMPIPSLQKNDGWEIWDHNFKKWEIDTGGLEEGVFIREFKNKSFHLPAWSVNGETEKKEELLKKQLWAPEISFIGQTEVRWEKNFSELEEALRESVQSSDLVQIIEDNVVQEVMAGNQKKVKILVGPERTIETEKVIFADRLNLWSSIKGIATNGVVPSSRSYAPVGVLQVNFEHKNRINNMPSEGVFCLPVRDKTEKVHRHIWGYVSASGLKSIWTMLVTPDESEDNHEVTKKLRQVKQSINWIFDQSGIMSGKKGFLENIFSEHVCFEEEWLFSKGKPWASPIKIDDWGVIITDGFGPAFSMKLVSEI